MFANIAIVGIGLIGGSIALAVRRRWPGTQIVAIARAEAIEAALPLNAADRGGEDLALAGGANLIILAAPIRQNDEVLRQLAAAVPGEALVTDVGSTKGATVSAAAALPPRLRFVGGHPVAGAAGAGLDVARPDLFRGRPWIFTPNADTEAADIATLSSFVAEVGAQPKTMTPEAHDRLMAYVSHLPQITISALMHIVGSETGDDGLRLAGTGLRDSTRLAGSPPGTWRDVAATNADTIAAAIDDLTSLLQSLKRTLTSGDELTRVFESAQRWKQTLDEPAGTRATRTYLEMTERSALQATRVPGDGIEVVRQDNPDPKLWRRLYTDVGKEYRWTDRLRWSDDDATAYLSDPDVSLWLLSVDGRTAGYFELHKEPDDSVEIVYFGLLPEFMGRRLGGHLLTEAVERAWRIGARRVWLHTCSFDHPFAILNYLSRGFTIFRTERYLVR